MQPGHDRKTVLTYRIWKSLFGSDPAVVGKSTIINNVPHTILGVLPGKAVKADDEELYLPLVFEGPLITERGLHTITTVGRLSPGISLVAAQRRMRDLSERLAKQYPKDDGTVRARLQPIAEAYVENVRTLLRSSLAR